MLSIDAIIKILYGFVAAFLIVVVLILLKRKFGGGGKGNSTDTANAIKPKRVHDMKKFVPVETIRDGMVTLTGEKRFIASINCKGFDLYTAGVDEQYRTQEGYLSFINTFQGPITLRIDSTAVDLSASIKRHEGALVRTREELQRCYEEFAQYRKLVAETTDEHEKATYAEALYEIERKGSCLENQVRHLEHLIKYQEKLSGKAANPIQEERYFIDWTFDPTEYPKNISDEEIEDHARKELASRVEQMRHALSRANIKCSRDDDKDLYDISYRHFHPYSADIYRNTDEINQHDRIISGERNFRDAQRRYLRARDDKYVRELIEKQIKAHTETVEAGVSNETEVVTKFEKNENDVPKIRETPAFQNVLVKEEENRTEPVRVKAVRATEASETKKDKDKPAAIEDTKQDAEMVEKANADQSEQGYETDSEGVEL